MNDYIAVLDKALNAGGEALLRYYGKLERYDTKSSERDLVTIADRESEAAVRAVLKGAYPLHEILGEEQGLEP
ncbi:MAG: inositol monophosphatase family protein, partial [Candidatus Sumerlaeaceae bacterium]